MADWWLKANVSGSHSPSLAPMHSTPLHGLAPTAAPSPMDGDPRHRHPSGAEEEPQSRLRANTWPLNPNLHEDEQEEQSSPALAPLPEEDGSGTSESVENVCQRVPGEVVSSGKSAGKKNSARRNPWGNMSYADLIEKSIESSPDKRLTLSQIYDWLVQNIPYFKEKADANSAAGWKNSVRHNLSLHNRFMRVQNETGTGKSSWWIVNQSAKFDKPSRRRAATMEPKEHDKRKPGRLKKGLLKDDYQRNGSPVLGSAGGSTGDLSGYAQHSLTDFRSRADSAASCYSCLSPRSPTPLDDHPSPTISPHAWHSPQPPTNPSTSFNYESDFSSQLAKTMRLSDANNRSMNGSSTATPVSSSYAPFAPALDTTLSGFFHNTQRSFPSIPEEPRLNFFNGTVHDTHHDAYHNPQHTITSANHASGGNFSTLSHYPYQWSSLPHDLESIAAEPVHSFDFDWEELLQQEAAIERMQHGGHVHTIVQPPHHNDGHRL